MSDVQRDTVLFLGAGFSAAAGLPVMAQFTKDSREDYKTIKGHDEAGRKLAAGMLRKAAETYYAFQRTCQKSPTLTTADSENLETIFCIAEAMHESGINSVRINDRVVSTDELSRQIALWLWKVYQQAPWRNRDRVSDAALYRSFFRVCGDAGLWDRTTVVSMNYDLVFETFAWEHGRPCHLSLANESAQPLGDFGNGQYVSWGSAHGARCIPICKLHGSVNFFDGTGDSLNVAACVGPQQGGIGKSFRFGDAPAVFALDWIAYINQRRPTLDYVPAIIPPTYAKLQRRPWLREMWRAAFDAISNARNLIFVGYSLPLTDGFIRALFHGAFATAETSRLEHVYVIDPGDHATYRNLFGTRLQDTGSMRLSEAVGSGLLQEIAAQCVT